MAKFYIESGDLRLVVHAHTARGAALWAVHRSLAQVLPFVGDDQNSDASTALSHPSKLADCVAANEQGFGRTDGQQFETLELVSEWNELMTALDRLQRRLEPATA